MAPELLTQRISTFNATANGKDVYHMRVFCAMIAGCIAGILGLTGWSGLLFYFFSAGLVGLFLMIRAGCKVKEYFPSVLSVFTSGIFKGVMTFVLFWTLSYDIVYVY